MPAAKNEGPIELVRIPKLTAEIPIVGITPLITHKWADKAKRQMLDKQMNPGTRAKKEAKDPEADYYSSRYIIDEDGDGFPATGFKAAMVHALRLFEGLPQTHAKQCLFVAGVGADQLVPIIGKPEMREDMVRIPSGADIRYRAEYFPWSAMLHIQYLPSMLNLKSLVALVDAAGLGGVGEWRPSAPKTASGSFGMFEVALTEWPDDEDPVPAKKPAPKKPPGSAGRQAR